MPNRPVIHLLCNAHIDPVWQWVWEEGVSAALATFRVAADLCETFPMYIFNHNEAILYAWIEEYDPQLFERIRTLIAAGKWHVMGGWWLQPDCNMPAGEGFVRQILHGKRYFMEKFGVEPRTAINFDPFGHDRGLVQILNAGGYDSYVICRPGQEDLPIPADVFKWTGADGSFVTVCKPGDFYNSSLGKAHEKIKNAINQDVPKIGHRLLLWGVGNHGGGPSRQDLENITNMIAEEKTWDICHSTPEKFFKDVASSGKDIPEVTTDLRPWGVGCYISMVLVKQRYRELENQLLATEKILALSASVGLLRYPGAKLSEACRDLLLSQFHDSLPGSGIEAVEQNLLRIMDHGLEILSRVRAKALFALAETQPKAASGEYPLIVLNPLPYSVETLCIGELMLADASWAESFTGLEVTLGGIAIPSQIEQESSSLNLDWRKRVVFKAVLPPSSLTRFSCTARTVPPNSVSNVPGQPHLRSGGFASRPQALTGAAQMIDGCLVIANPDGLEVAIDLKSGIIRYLKIGGSIRLKDAFLPVVLADTPDPWGMTCRGWNQDIASFRGMDPLEAGRFAGLKDKPLLPVRVIEDGEIRTVVEALLTTGTSHIRLRYEIPRHGTTIGLEARVNWMETDCLLKLDLPFPEALADGWRFLGEGACNRSNLPRNGEEAVFHRWLAVDGGNDQTISIISTNTYAADCTAHRLRLTLMRSPGYCAHPMADRPIVPQDRHTLRMDQGVRMFRFIINAGATSDRLARVTRESEIAHQAPVVFNFFPGASRMDHPLAGGLHITDDCVEVTACKRSEDNQAWIVRLYEPTGTTRRTRLVWPSLGIDHTVELLPWKILSLRIDDHGQIHRCDLIERSID